MLLQQIASKHPDFLASVFASDLAANLFEPPRESWRLVTVVIGVAGLLLNWL
jgi:hypothetical protein